MKYFLAFLFFFPGVSMAIEEPKYSVVSKTKTYEIRQYEPVIVAETKIDAKFDRAGNEAFKILAGYIFGANKSKTKIEMTAPVSQVAKNKSESEKIEMTTPVNQIKSASGFVVQFTMPKQYTLETLPLPNDSRVELRQVPSRKVAVLSYSGSWSEKRYNKKLAKLKTALENDKLKIQGEPVFARFNSPFQLWFLRRNEIWLELSQ
jgi:hypothetical protein